VPAVIDRVRAPVLREEPRAQLPERAERETILARARSMAASHSVARPPGNAAAAVVEAKCSAVAEEVPALSRRQAASEPPLLPGRRVRLQMFCSGSGVAFVGVGLEHEGYVQLIGHEFPQRGDGGGTAAPVRRAYTYIGALRTWDCPACRLAPAGVEAFGCACACFSDVLHCGGRAGGNVYCACGAFGEPNFRRVPTLSVRGHVSASPPAAPLGRAGPPMQLLTGPPQAPQPLLPRCLR
jgi:hypothetical protein